MTKKEREEYLENLRKQCDKKTVSLLVDYLTTFNGDSRSQGQKVGINLVIEELNAILQDNQ